MRWADWERCGQEEVVVVVLLHHVIPIGRLQLVGVGARGKVTEVSMSKQCRGD